MDRRDERALRVRENAPGLERQIELLNQGARCLQELGRIEQARAVNRLARDMRRRETPRER